jgi:hypothetical protein
MPISIVNEFDSSSETELEYFDNEDENEDYETIYEPEESSLTKYNIILCELYNNKLHGNNANNNIHFHYLVHSRFKNLNMSFINETCLNRKLDYYVLSATDSNKLNHNRIRNYRNIVSGEGYIKPEIAQCIYLQTQECVAILKTFWIRLIQRRWKNILAERKRVMEKRNNIISIMYREIYGNWPNGCLRYPRLRGMLSNLN